MIKPEIPPIPSVEAVEYGRRVMLNEIGKLKDFEKQARTKGDEDAAERWKLRWKWMDWKLVGPGEGCVITAFDARWLDPEFRRIYESARPIGRHSDSEKGTD